MLQEAIEKNRGFLRVCVVLAVWTSLLSHVTRADALFPLDKVMLGADANSVDRMVANIDWGAVEKTPSGAIDNAYAFAKVSSPLWSSTGLGFAKGRLTSVAYMNPLAKVPRQQEIVRQVYREMLSRYGKPDQVLASEQPAISVPRQLESLREVYKEMLSRTGKPDQMLASEQSAVEGIWHEPVFLWRRQDRIISFSYTPFAMATDGKQHVALQVMLPDLPLSMRYKVVEVPVAEMERLTVDVAGITAPPVSPVPIANNLFPLDNVPLGSDVNSVEGMCPTLEWADFRRMDPGEKQKPTGKVIAFVKVKSQFWDVAMLTFTNGRFDLVAYTRVLVERAANKELIRQIYTDLVTRCGKPDQVVASEQAITDGTRNAPIFVWNKKGRTIVFTYTPLAAVTYYDKQTLALQITLPEKQLSERSKIVEVSAAEMERLTVDVASITAPPIPPAPIANGTTGQGRSPYLWPIVGAIVVVVAAGVLLTKKSGKPK